MKARAKVPKTAAIGEVIVIKTLLTHPMETGHRPHRETGELIPRDIVTRFQARFNDRLLVDVDLGSGIAANPYFDFDFKVAEAGVFRFDWTDEHGRHVMLEKPLALT